uniref:Protein HRI1 n=1 Tax=Talaromyces marneffei PM1 TaxID=1077442 RepID=A0A093UNJ1_TALMA
MTVRASTLISVQWPPDPISQGPDTLVLSVGTYYVDLRVNRDDGSIYWALAGRRIVVSEEPRKVKFTHEIDSHHTSPATTEEEEENGKGEEEVADEGLFTKLPNGDDLEIGEMPAPHRGGKVSAYREVWRELKIGFDHSDSGEGDETCWMLESLDMEKRKRTFYCKVGRFFLALRRMESSEVEFSAIRQEQTPSQTGGKEWVTKYSIGKEVDDMFHMSTSSEFVLENVTTDRVSWKVDDQVVTKSREDGAVREGE